MKFVEIFSAGGRLGCLTEIPTLWCSDIIQTPMCLMYTCSGAVPHLTYDVLKHVDKNNMNLFLQPLPTIASFQEPIEQLEGDLGHFIGLPQRPFHISMQNPTVCIPSGYNVKKGVAVWTQGGKKILSPEEFIRAQNAFQPFSYQALCDSDTPENCTKKRLLKSVSNTLCFLDRCLKIHSDMPRLKDTSIFGTVQGGFDIDLRIKSAKETAERRVDGFVIDGFHLSGCVTSHAQFRKIKPILEGTVSCLPTEKPRMINGPLSLSSVIEAVDCGIDIFDSSYANLLSEMGEAVLPFYNSEPVYLEEKRFKNCKQPFKIDLKDFFYADKFVPISNHCRCHTCLNFTCAYIHHLLMTSELLGRILLMLHNMSQMAEFFSNIRKSIADQSFHHLKEMIVSLT